MGLSRRHHVAAKGYLRGFADEHGRLERFGSERLVHVSGAAVKKDAYLVELRDGTRTDEVERALGVLEDTAVPLLRDLEKGWPLSRSDRAVLAEYLALQMSRTPDALRRQAQLVEAGLKGAGYRDAPDTGWRQGRDGLRMRAMLAITRHVMTLVSAMQWSLVKFNAAVLSTCDHPVAVVSIDLGQTTADLGVGVANIGELWLPINSQLLLICCWRDLPDTRRPLGGLRRVAESVNWAMRDQAEAGWYWQPETTPPIRDDRPIRVCGQVLFHDYGPTAIRRSSHRAQALRQLQSAGADMSGSATVFHSRSS